MERGRMDKSQVNTTIISAHAYIIDVYFFDNDRKRCLRWRADKERNRKKEYEHVELRADEDQTIVRNGDGDFIDWWWCRHVMRLLLPYEKPHMVAATPHTLREIEERCTVQGVFLHDWYVLVHLKKQSCRFMCRSAMVQCKSSFLITSLAHSVIYDRVNGLKI